jgi:serine O-acetyltransferase
MIKSKADYRFYLKQDKIALGIPNLTLRTFLKNILLPSQIYKFQKMLRKAEYVKNCKTNRLGKIEYFWVYYRFTKLSLRLGFSIPLNVFGPGLAIVHYGTIVVNAKAKVGANCRIHPSTCIGASGGLSKAPQIGDNCYLAPGVKIYGDITLANNIITAANAAIGKSFLESNILIGGVPAIKIKEIDVSKIIKHITNDSISKQ